MLRQQIEEASLNAWPALRQVLYDGWVLRFSKGYTKRANSANPLYASTIDVCEKIGVCEKLYAEKELPSIFRITPFASPPDLDHVLESRGYDKIDLTLVLHLDLAGDVGQIVNLSYMASEQVREQPLDDWLAAFCRLKSSSLDKHQTHREILQAIPSRRYMASLTASGEIVSCGVGVLEMGFFGLFDIVTAPEHRNKGYGTRLISSMLAWARENGAAHAYLGVVESNVPARRLYAKFGYEEAYRYWYRIPKCA